MEIFYKNYPKHITVHLTQDFYSLFDTTNGTSFRYLKEDNSLAYRDAKGNIWTSKLETLTDNGHKFLPEIGSVYILNNRYKYCYTTNEEVMERATEYFKKLIRIGFDQTIGWKGYFYNGTFHSFLHNDFHIHVVDILNYNKVRITFSFN